MGGNTSQNIYQVPVPTAYQNEIVSPVESTTYSAKIGLIYVSDYGYSAIPTYWTINLNAYNSSDIIQNNWMYLGSNELTISRSSSSTYTAFYVASTGAVGSYGVFDYSILSTVYTSQFATRPVFYLNSSITYSGGTGEASNPVRIN